MRVNYTRPAALLAAGLITTLSIVTVQKALAVTTVANATKTTFALPANGTANFAAPTINAPFFLMATQLDSGWRGVASGTFAYSTHAGNEMMSWVGINSFQASQTDASLASGWVTAGGVTALKVGWAGSSRIETFLDGAGNPSRLLVRNASGSPRAVVVTMVW